MKILYKGFRLIPFFIMLLFNFIFLSEINLPQGWTQISSVPAIAKAISFANPQVGYISAELGAVYKTTDGGYSWQWVLDAGSKNFWYGVYAFSPDKVIISGFTNTPTAPWGGFYRWTTDGGTTWTNDIGLAPGAGSWCMAVGFTDSLHGMITGQGGYAAGIAYVTTNGGVNWAPRQADPTNGWFGGNFTLMANGKYYLTGVKFCRSTDFGRTWTWQHSVDDVFDGGVSFPDTLHGWTGGGTIMPTVDGWVHRTTDGGTTWSGKILQTTYPIRGVFFLDSLNGFAQGGYGPHGGIWDTKDGGLTWTQFSTSGEMTGADWKYVSQDSIDIWSVGYSPTGSAVYKKRISIIPVPVELTSFTANVKNNKVILDWTTATELNNRGFEIQRSSSLHGQWAIVGYVSGNGTTTEVKHYTFSEDQVTPGTYSYRLKQMDYDGRSKYSTEVNIEVAPFNFTLSQNYPNPFNPSTVIKFGIPKSSLVNLKIYDVLGNEVAALVNEEKQPGTYEVNFNGSALSSGVYFYTLTAGEFSSTKKIILMK